MSKPTPARSDSRRAQLRAAQIQQAQREKNKRIAIFSVIGVVVIALVVGGVLLFNRFNANQAARAADGTPPNANAERTGIITHPGKAKPDAVKVELFADYQCPACAAFERTYGSVLDQMAESGEIELENRTMTFLDTNLRNDSSTRAANAAACADQAGHYFEYHNAVFSHQPTQEGSGYTDDNLTKDFTQQAGITGAALDEFNACYRDKRYSGFVSKVDDEAGRAGVTSTPTVRVNGKDFDRNKLTQDPNSLRTEILAMR